MIACKLFVKKNPACSYDNGAMTTRAALHSMKTRKQVFNSGSVSLKSTRGNIHTDCLEVESSQAGTYVSGACEV